MAVGIGLVLISALIDRILVAFLARRSVQKILKNKANLDPRALEDPKYGSVAADADCLRISSAKGDKCELHWSDVEEVHAFKRDLLTTDLICLTFKKSGKEEYYEIHEEVAGFHDLLKILPSHLSKFPTDWFSAIAFPAFETKHQIIWKRTPNQTAQQESVRPGS